MSDTKEIPGTFAWNELATSDAAGSEKFYTELFGWTMVSPPDQKEGFGGYKMIMAGEEMVGGFMDKSEHCDGPPLWLSYVHVEDVQATLDKAVKLGAKAIKEVTDVPGMGTFAMIQDPQGGMIAFWKSAANAEGC